MRFLWQILSLQTLFYFSHPGSPDYVDFLFCLFQSLDVFLSVWLSWKGGQSIGFLLLIWASSSSKLVKWHWEATSKAMMSGIRNCLALSRTQMQKHAKALKIESHSKLTQFQLQFMLSLDELQRLPHPSGSEGECSRGRWLILVLTASVCNCIYYPQEKINMLSLSPNGRNTIAATAMSKLQMFCCSTLLPQWLFCCIDPQAWYLCLEPEWRGHVHLSKNRMLDFALRSALRLRPFHHGSVFWRCHAPREHLKMRCYHVIFMCFSSFYCKCPKLNS